MYIINALHLALLLLAVGIAALTIVTETRIGQRVTENDGRDSKQINHS